MTPAGGRLSEGVYMVDDERVTLRLLKGDLGFLDMFVEAGIFPSRSEAIRQAIKDLIQSRATALEQALNTRQKLIESAARLHSLQSALEEHREQKLDRVETEALRKVEKR